MKRIIKLIGGLKMKNDWTKKLLSIIGITIGAFIGFNLSFMLAAVITLSVAKLTGPLGYTIGRLIFLVVIYLIFALTKQLKIPVWIKAAVFTMPMISSLIIIGVYGYGLAQWMVLGGGALFVLAVLYYLWRNKWDWTYYYALGFVSVVAAYVIIAGIDI